MTAKTGDRSIYLHEYACEEQPCDPTPEGYAKFLAQGGTKYWPCPVPSDGDTFEGSAIEWLEDVVATRKDGKWTLSRELDTNQFAAIRLAEGMGWWPDNIISENMEFIEGEYVATETMTEAAVRMLTEIDECCEDTEFIAVGRNVDKLVFTYRTDPPRLIERAVQ